MLLGLVALHPVLGADFVLVDDHEILGFSPQVRNDSELRPPPDVVTRVLVDDAASGRARPLYWVIRYAESALLGAHPMQWHALYLGFGLLAAALFYLTLGSVGIGWLSSFLAAMWLVVLPGVSSVWIRLGPQESVATVLLLLGGLAVARGARPGSSGLWDWVFVLTVSASALVKESFALAPPAILAFRVFVFYIRRGRKAVWSRAMLLPGLVTVGVGVVVVAMALVTANRSQTGSYGHEILAAASLEPDAATLLNLELLALSGGIVAPILIGGVLFEGLRWRNSTSRGRMWLWLAGAATVCLLILPQLVLYRSHGGFAVGRYLLPSGLGMAAAVAAGTEWSRRLGQRAVVLAVTSVWAIIVIVGGAVTWRDAEYFRVDSLQLGRMLDALTQTPTGSVIAIAADPVRDQEFVVSLPFHLAARARPDLHTRLVAATAGQDTSDCSDIAAVVLFAPEADAISALPCLGASSFRLESFSATVTMGEYVPEFIRDLFPPVYVEYAVLFHLAA